MVNDITPGLLEEYGELREEIRTYLSRREQSKNFVFMITLAVVGLDSSSLVSFGELVFTVSALLIWFLWFDEIGRMKAIFRVATYIQTFLEPEVPGLNWETLGGRHKIQTSWTRRIMSNAEFPLLFLGFVGLTWWRLRSSHPLIANSGAVIAVLMAAGLSFSSLQVSRRGRRTELANWLKLKSELELESTDNTPPGIYQPANGLQKPSA